MSIVDCRPALRKLLIDNAAIQAVVSGRIYPLVLAQGERRDSIVYSRISGSESYTFTAPSGLSGPRYQFDAWSETSDGAAALADLVKDQLGGYSGIVYPVGDSPDYYVSIRGIFFANETDDYDGTLMMYRMSRDYFVWFAERNS